MHLNQAPHKMAAFPLVRDPQSLARLPAFPEVWFDEEGLCVNISRRLILLDQNDADLRLQFGRDRCAVPLDLITKLTVHPPGVGDGFTTFVKRTMPGLRELRLVGVNLLKSPASRFGGQFRRLTLTNCIVDPGAVARWRRYGYEVVVDGPAAPADAAADAAERAAAVAAAEAEAAERAAAAEDDADAEAEADADADADAEADAADADAADADAEAADAEAADADAEAADAEAADAEAAADPAAADAAAPGIIHVADPAADAAGDAFN
jgi:hypothetical protein